MYYPFVRKALFQLDPERAHEFTFQQLRRITGTPLEALVRQRVPEKPVQCMGLTFKNPPGRVNTSHESDAAGFCVIGQQPPATVSGAGTITERAGTPQSAVTTATVAAQLGRHVQ